MKVQILYTSLTGRTRKLAQAIGDGLSGHEVSLHDIAREVPELDGDVILLGFWGMMGGPCKEMQQVMKSVKGRTVGVFCTLGYYADTDHGHQTIRTALDLLKDDNLILGSYVCSGAIAQNLKEGQGKQENAVPTEQKELRWEMFASHPTDAECALAAERFRERVHMLERSRELKIPLQSVL